MTDKFLTLEARTVHVQFCLFLELATLLLNSFLARKAGEKANECGRHMLNGGLSHSAMSFNILVPGASPIMSISFTYISMLSNWLKKKSRTHFSAN